MLVPCLSVINESMGAIGSILAGLSFSTLNRNITTRHPEL